MDVERVWLYVAVLAALLTGGVRAEDRELTNYKSGISLTFSGTKGTAYMEEYLYHDKLVSDRKIVYIRDTTRLIMEHNEYNNVAQMPGVSNSYFYIIGKDGRDSVPNSGDEGIIRYRVDRDLQVAWNWAGNKNAGGKLPAYDGPFAFADLAYETDVPVVGTVGSNGQPMSDKTGHYWRGHTGPFGDEWHTIAVADDDSAFIAPSKVVYWSSDGKEFIFVVNPKTPAMTVRATGDAEFYTTPPKAYFVPKIHAQTTCFNAHTGTVTFELKDLYGHEVYYRINGGTWQHAANPVLDQDDFTDGTNTLEYYYEGNQAYTKTRTVIKDPVHPSLAEPHGNFLWKDQAEWDRIKARLGRAPYAAGLQKMKVDAGIHFQSVWDETGRSPHRRIFVRTDPFYASHPSVQDASMSNAFVALVEGWEYTRSGAAKSYGRYAVEMVIGNSFFRVDPIGWEHSHPSSPHPSSEVISAGYYAAPAITSGISAYDIIATHFRDDQVAGGLTAIEDYYVRDQFARYALTCLQYHYGDVGMWDTAQDMGAMMVAMCMTEYTSPVYGTSGYGTVQTAYTYTPYPDQAFTWKRIYSDRDIPLMEYPNCPTQRDPEADDLWLPDGQWAGSNLGYASLMKTTYDLLLNMTELHAPDSFPEVRAAKLAAVNGELIGTGKAETTFTFHPEPMLCNYKFPVIGPLVRPSLVSRDIEQSELASGNVFKLVWYDDSLSAYLAPIREPVNRLPDGLSVYTDGGDLVIEGLAAAGGMMTLERVSGEAVVRVRHDGRIPLRGWAAGVYIITLPGQKAVPAAKLFIPPAR